MAAPSSGERIQADTLALAQQLIARPSLTPDDGGCLDVVETRLSAAGFECERIAVEGVSNLWARRGQGAPLVCFAGHVDVVPPGPEGQWSVPPFSGVVHDGWLYGRGAADMKTSVAAMVTAAERLAASSVQPIGSLAVLLTSDEEGDAVHGTAAVVERLMSRQQRIDYCLVGEPTSSHAFGDTIKNGRRGSLNGLLRVIGVQGHVAYPERSRNPIHQVAPALADLCAAQWDAGNADFAPTTFQVSNMAGGTGAPNVVPGSVDVQFNFRFSPESTVDGLKARVEKILGTHGLTYELSWAESARPFVTPRGRLVEAIADAVKATTGLAPTLSTSGGTSDGRFLASVAREVAEFGPMNDTIHKVDERVAVADVGRLSDVYERVARNLLQR